MESMLDNSADPHNPFAAPQVTDSGTAESEDSRPAWLILFLIFQILCYAAFVGLSGFALTGVLVGLPLRLHEVVLLVAAIACSPVVAWFGVLEVLSVARPIPGRERVLARFAMWTTIAPIVLAAFWLFEFQVYGSFEANGAPAVLAGIFAFGWFLATTKRYLLSRRRSHRSLEEVAAEVLKAASRGSEDVAH